MEFDSTIVGNGAVSCALALRLSEAYPGHRIALIGAAARPGSASLAAGAMLNVFAELTPGALNPPWAREKFRAALRASQLWEGHLATLNRRLRTGAPVLLEQGTHVVANSLAAAQDDAALEVIASSLRTYEQPFREVNPASIPGVAPAPHRRPRRALYLEAEGTVSAERLHRAYDEALSLTPSVSVLEGEVAAIRPAGDRSRAASKVELSDGRVLATRQIVVAAGSRSQPLIEQLGLARRIPRLVHGVGVALILKTAGPVPTKVFRTPNRGLARGLYVVPYSRGYCYVGATNDLSLAEAPAPRVHAVHYLLEAAIEQVHPSLGDAHLHKILVGYRPITLDGYPLIGETSIPGVWIVSGTRRDGLHLSPVIAEEMTRALSSGAQPLGGVFAPERRLQLEDSRQRAIDRAVAALCAAQAERPGAVLGGPLDEDAARTRVLEAYARCGLAAGELGIPIELLELYRDGVAAANLGEGFGIYPPLA